MNGSESSGKVVGEIVFRLASLDPAMSHVSIAKENAHVAGVITIDNDSAEGEIQFVNNFQ